MAAPQDPRESPAIRRLARQIAGLQRQVTALASTPGTGHSSMEGGSLDGFTVDGQLTTRTGEQHDGTFGSAVLAGPVPPTPTVPVVQGGPGLARIGWDGGWLNGALTPMDFSRVEVYVSTDSISDPLPRFLVATIETPQGAEVVIRREAGTYHARLASRSASGKVSALSDETVVEVASLVDTAEVEAALATKTSTTRSDSAPDRDGQTPGDVWWRVHGIVVVEQWVWDGETWVPVEASGSIIAAATIHGEQISATALDGKVITGALIRTAAEGRRIELGAATGDQVVFHTGRADQISPGVLRVGAGDEASYVDLVAPETAAHQGSREIGVRARGQGVGSPLASGVELWGNENSVLGNLDVLLGDLSVAAGDVAAPTGTLRARAAVIAEGVNCQGLNVQWLAVSGGLSIGARRLVPFAHTIATTAAGRSWWHHGLGATPVGIVVSVAMDTVGGPNFPTAGMLERTGGDVPTNAETVAIRLMGNSSSAWGAVPAGTWDIAGFYIV
ncbi:hypothetical protein FA014_01860 [Cellulomonas hominis]|uniref:Uncharacterized protein n=1 Tax=Cellulomonas hominis TaxID=156981 RepID=A0A7Z8K2Z9_9CELL|nr:hypothetical protein [Cellulomonas hominis]TKR27127.1 hypothetical protein FA014_01860 [Cellulomonas hominis]